MSVRGFLKTGLALGAALTALSGCAMDRPRLTSGEYLRSWGLAAINANPAYVAGVSGRGVTVALVDCGLDRSQPDLRRNVSRQSADLLTSRLAPAPIARHANLVAGPLGSALDGRGLVGVAYNADVLAIRADVDGGWNGQCAFRTADLARALDFAVEKRARIVVLPVQHPRPLGGGFEPALQRAVDAGLVVVVSAGNRAGAEPEWPARYAADPRFAGSLIAVGASREDGSLAAWSNRAGETRQHFVAAPGEGVITDCGKETCRQVSGTSFAAPYVAGALALVMEARPDLDGRDAARLLLSGAQDAGEPGDDPVYGQGLLNVGRAFAQIRRPARGG